MDEVIELGSSALTAKNLGKAKKGDGFFGKTEATTDSSGKKNNSSEKCFQSCYATMLLGCTSGCDFL